MVASRIPSLLRNWLHNSLWLDTQDVERGQLRYARPKPCEYCFSSPDMDHKEQWPYLFLWGHNVDQIEACSATGLKRLLVSTSYLFLLIVWLFLTRGRQRQTTSVPSHDIMTWQCQLMRNLPPGRTPQFYLKYFASNTVHQNLIALSLDASTPGVWKPIL